MLMRFFLAGLGTLRENSDIKSLDIFLNKRFKAGATSKLKKYML